MSVSIDIHPSSHTLDMYGEPDIFSAYSLSGHVSVSLAPPSSLFGSRRRATRLLLESLIITFEGQSEVFTRDFGYAPLRLCSLARDLAPSEPMELTNEGLEDSDQSHTWNVLFNLIVPGWLPATAVFGYELEADAGTRYALFATAKFISLDDPSEKTLSFSTLCSVFYPRTRTLHAPKCTVTLRRFTNAPSVPFSSTSLFPMSNYALCAKPTRDSPSIPLDILSMIKVVASAPQCLSIDETSVPLAIRLRTTNQEDAVCKRLRVTSFSIDIVQIEKYRGMPSSDYASRYPIPSWSAQPPNKPLLDPHPFHTLYDTGLLGASVSPHLTVVRSFSVMHTAHSGDYQLAGDGYIFADDYNTRERPTWYTINTSVPLAQSSTRSCERRVSGSSPLFDIRHEVHVILTCAYDVPETSQTLSEALHVSIPLCFVHVTPTSVSCGTSSSPSLTTSDSPHISAEPVPQAEMLPCSLPAYSQLFDSNGDRKIDHSVLLPVYTPHSPLADFLQLDAAASDDQGRKLSLFFVASDSST